MSTENEKPHIEAGVYEHFKGDHYVVTGEVLADWSDGAQEKWKVLYVTPLGERGIRGYKEFTGTVFRDGETKPRFRRISE